MWEQKGAGVPAGLQIRFLVQKGEGWVRFPHAPAKNFIWFASYLTQALLTIILTLPTSQTVKSRFSAVKTHTKSNTNASPKVVS